MLFQLPQLNLLYRQYVEFGHFIKDFLGVDDKTHEHLDNLQISFTNILSSFTLLANEFNGFHDGFNEQDDLDLDLDEMELPKLSRLFTNEKSAQLSSMPVLKLERLFSSSVYKKEVDF